MRVVIIDDETKARSVLKTLIQENCKQCTEIVEANNLLDGVELIKQNQPQLVFLDIEMPEHSGLEIGDFLPMNLFQFELIFVTAYSQYAIQAFELNAIDYILKPLSPTQIKKTIEKAITQIGKNQIANRLVELKKCLSDSNYTKIGLPYADGIKFVDYNHILYFEADGMYTNVSIHNQQEIYVSKPLKFFVDQFAHINTFYKCHRSYFIHIRYIKEYIKRDGGFIVMENNASIPIARDKRNEFLQLMNGL